MATSSISELVTIRYSKPLEALKEDATLKVLLSVAALIFSTITDIISTLGDIFNTPAELIILLLVAIIGDLITGVKCAKQNDVYIRSLGFRQTWVKIIEYTIGLLILAGIANVFGTNTLQGWVGESLRYLKNIHWFGYFYCIFTEFKSIAENTSGKEGRFSEVIDKINRKFFGKKDEDKVR